MIRRSQDDPPPDMTLAQLKRHVDVKFATVDRRFDSLDDKIEAVLRYARSKIDTHERAIHTFESRLQDLEESGPRGDQK